MPNNRSKHSPPWMLDRGRTWSLTVAAATWTALMVGPAVAQNAEAARDVTSTRQAGQAPLVHTVVQGETMRGLAKYYFGDARRWSDIHRLNPTVNDPDLLAIGQRVRVPYPPRLPTDSAVLTRQARRVEERISPLAWSSAENRHVLRHQDALRTFEAASAELAFADETSLLLTENSLVIVGLNEPVPRVAPADVQVELKLGQADLQGLSPRGQARDIEIVIGNVATRPRPGADGVIQTRTRKPEAGGAQVMMFEGEGEVASGGEQVRLAAGTGSVVPEGAPPGAPEALLEAAVTEAPAAGARIVDPRPWFRWRSVTDAVSYTVEVCADADCGRLVARATGVTDTRWRPDPLPVDALFWRATAVSLSGLDGYPSPAVAFAVVAEQEDQEGPSIAIRLEADARQDPRFGLNDVPIVGRGATLAVDLEDPSGVAGWTPILDGEEVTEAVWRGPWASGPHTVAVIATDNVGNERRSTLSFVYDPDPPMLHWGVQGSSALGQMAGRDGAAEIPDARGWRQWRPDDVRPRRALVWRITSDGAQVRLWPETRKPLHVADLDQTIDAARGLWVLAEDGGCPGPPARLVYDLEAGPSTAGGKARGKNLRLVVEAVDCVGNTSRMVWPLQIR